MIEDTKSKEYFREASKQKIQNKDASKISSLEINFTKEQKISNDFRTKITNDINTVAEKVSENNDILERTLKLQSKILSILEEINLNSNTSDFDIPNIPGLSNFKNLKGVAKIGVAAAAAALVALGLYKMSGENADENFKKSDTARENLEKTRRQNIDATGDIPDPASPEVQKMNKNEATSLIMSYDLSGDKLNDWLNAWQSKKTDNVGTQQQDTVVPAAPVVSLAEPVVPPAAPVPLAEPVVPPAAPVPLAEPVVPPAAPAVTLPPEVTVPAAPVPPAAPVVPPAAPVVPPAAPVPLAEPVVPPAPVVPAAPVIPPTDNVDAEQQDTVSPAPPVTPTPTPAAPTTVTPSVPANPTAPSVTPTPTPAAPVIPPGKIYKDSDDGIPTMRITPGDIQKQSFQATPAQNENITKISSTDSNTELQDEIKLTASNIIFSADNFEFRVKNAPSESIRSISNQNIAPVPISTSPLTTTNAAATAAVNDPLAAAVNNLPSPETPPPVTSGDFIRPVDDQVTSPFGMRAGGDHKGIDFGSKMGTPVKAAVAGTVIKANTGDNGGYGNLVTIKSQDGTETRYAHLSNIGVKEGQQVKAGDIIGNSGNTGRSTGPHLHFEIIKDGKQVDPAPLISAGSDQKQDATVAPSTPDTAAAPSVESTSASNSSGAELINSPNNTGITALQASQTNEAVSAAGSRPIVNVTPFNQEPAQAERGIGAIQTPIDPNDPGNVEPPDATIRYQKLFGMSAYNLAA